MKITGKNMNSTERRTGRVAGLILILCSTLISLALIEAFAWFAVDTYYKQKTYVPTPALMAFYTRHSRTTNHLRHFDIFERLGIEEKQENYDHLIFSRLSSGDKQLLIQGDSWAEQFLLSEYSREKLSRLEGRFSVYAAGTSSYSPSLMTAQLDLLVNEFGLQPSRIVAVIDQTDIGDELCRYRKGRFKAPDGAVSVPPFDIDKGDHPGEVFSNSQRWANTQLFYSEGFALVKIVKYIFSKQEYKRFDQNLRRKCLWEDITRPLAGNASDEEYEYFQQTVLDYIERVFTTTRAERLMFLTHFHEKHIQNVYLVNVADLVRGAIKRSNHAGRIDLVEIKPEDYPPQERNPGIFDVNAPSHLTAEKHGQQYTDAVIQWVIGEAH